MAYTRLVDCPTLAAHLEDPRWVVVDCRFELADPDAGRRAYEAGHVPGARYGDLERHLSGPATALSGRHPLPDPHDLAARLGDWGIAADSQVVAYDDAGGAFAARLWWLLHWLGHEAAAVLDGGLTAWLAQGRAVTTNPPRIRARTFAAGTEGASWVDSDGLLAALGEGGCRLIDARAPERYRGEHEPIDPVAGHVPGALNIPYARHLDPGQRFLPSRTLAELFRAHLGGRRDQPLVAMCGSGVTACHSLLALALAGYRNARLYPGSWSEWIRDPHRPVIQGAEPGSLEDTAG